MRYGIVIQEQMHAANELGCMQEIGAIQAHDVIREELGRAAEQAEREKHAARHLSTKVKRLYDWASARRTAGASPASSSSVSSSSPPKMPKQQAPATAAPLKLEKVPKRVPKEVSVLKRFEIRPSGVEGAGDGLYLMEAAKDCEEIARYSGVILNAEQARQSKSEYIVKVSKNVFLDASGEGHWEGNKANCARKAKKKVNARISAASKPRYRKVSGRYWLPLLAVGPIKHGDEIFPDYGDEFWPSEDNLQTPEENGHDTDAEECNDAKDPPWLPEKESVSKKLDFGESAGREPLRRSNRPKGQDQDDSGAWMAEQIAKAGAKAKRKHAAEAFAKVPKEEDSDEPPGFSSDDNAEPQSEPMRASCDAGGSKTYVASVGRCIGMFRSAARVHAATYKFPRCKKARCKSEKEAKEWLADHGILRPVKFWQKDFATGSLLADPEDVIGTDVYFPAGMDKDALFRHGHGVVTETRMSQDTRVWEVGMDDGSTDVMTEWPLLCGMAEAASFQELSPKVQCFGVRGSKNDGVVTTMNEVADRMEGEHGSEYEVFTSVEEAWTWVQAGKRSAAPTVYYAIGFLLCALSAGR